jgi:hypothetical protein
MRGWRSFWAIGWTVSVVTLASAQYQFVHLRSYTLADLFDGTANGIGSNIGDVAFDGTNLYVAGYHIPVRCCKPLGWRESATFSTAQTLSPVIPRSRLTGRCSFHRMAARVIPGWFTTTVPSIWARD